jgi:hypothetical protein
VNETFAPQPPTDARLDQQVDRALLEQTGTDAGFDILARLALEHDRSNPVTSSS